LPARYSIDMGAGKNASAAVQYLASSSMPQSLEYEYTHTTQCAGCFCKQTSTSKAEVSFDNVVAAAGSLSLVSAVASSSAFLGQVDAYSIGEICADRLHGEFAMFFAQGDAKNAFSGALELLQQRNFEAAVSKELVCAIDGYIVDNSGIATAVATGSREIVAILVEQDDPQTFYDLFAPSGEGLLLTGSKRNFTPTAADADNLRMTAKVTTMGYYIFAQPSKSIQDIWQSLTKLSVPEESKQFLTSISYGTINVKTICNSYFNIDEGQDVTLHLLNVNSTLNLGVLEDFHSYGVLVQEIMDTFQQSEVTVQTDILPWFLAK